MRKIYIILLIFVVVACSTSDGKHVWIHNLRNEKIYVELDGTQNAFRQKLVFIQHGLASNLNHVAVQVAKRAFLDQGYVVVTFDSRYSLGQSDGDVEAVGLDTFVQDLTTVVDWAKQQPFYHEPFAVSGHSLGGASVLLYAAQHPMQVETLIPITPVVSGKAWEETCLRNMPEFCQHWKETGFYEYKTADKTAIIPYQLIENTKSYNAMDLARQIKARTLFVAAQNDVIVHPTDIHHLYTQMLSNAIFLIVAQSGHNFENEYDQKDLYKVISTFLTLHKKPLKL